uniref:Uncharacterized protein n=1 Tax=Setaria italica TaxID=4555 RepID=A0A0Q3TKC6_SETIT
ENSDEENEEAATEAKKRKWAEAAVVWAAEAVLAEVLKEERAKMRAAKKRRKEERAKKRAAKKRRGEEEVDSEMAKKRRRVDFYVDAGPSNASPATLAIVGPAAPAIVGPALESSGNSSEGSS